MEHACNGYAVCSKTSQEKPDTIEVVLTFSTPSTNKTADTPSICDRTCIMVVPYSMLHCVEKSVTEK